MSRKKTFFHLPSPSEERCKRDSSLHYLFARTCEWIVFLPSPESRNERRDHSSLPRGDYFFAICVFSVTFGPSVMETIL